MNNDAALRSAQRRYDAMLPDPEPPEADEPEPDFTGVRLRLKRKQLRISLMAMARELDIFPSYLHDLESGQVPWPDDVVTRYEQALTNHHDKPMGLDTSHDCWHGAYSAFQRWRQTIAHVAGLPPLELMQGFWNQDKAVLGNPFWRQLDEDKRLGYDHSMSIWHRLPIRWESLKPSPLHALLHHSDCEGEIPWENCAAIADALEALIPKLPTKKDAGHIGDWRQKTQTFVDGLRNAAAAQENVVFQ